MKRYPTNKSQYLTAGSRTYPFIQVLDPTDEAKCKNEVLKKAGNQFFIDRIEQMNTIFFVAYVPPEGAESKDYFGTLNGDKGGICDGVVTKPEFQGCGIAKYLMRTCYEDPHILGKGGKGVDVRTKIYWDKEGRSSKVNEYCEAITFTTCQPDDKTDVHACISYLRAAGLANFDVLFSFVKKGMPSYHGFMVDDAEEKFGADANAFIQNNGKYWFFCKCKISSKTECIALIK